MNELPGLLPPQATELEEAVLGAMLLEKEAVMLVSEILKPASFYKKPHELIYSAIMELYGRSEPVDLLTIMQLLKKNGQLDAIGGAYYLTQLTSGISSAANTEFHARIISQKYIQRELIRISNETSRSAYSEATDCFDLIDRHEKEITALTQNFASRKAKPMSTYWREVQARNTILLTKKGMSGTRSGFSAVDEITGGWQDTDLIIIAARPAMGKTALACNFARNAAVDFKRPGVIFSLEMSGLQLAQRLFAMESSISNSKFMRKGIPEEEMPSIEEIVTRLINSGLYIDDSSGLSIMELRSRLRRYVRDHGITWAVIDYLQLMEGAKNAPRENREQIISGITRALKSMAKELGIPIIALSQLSRAVETRGGQKKPQLSDLRESGGIEQDADVVLFIHRPEYYSISEYENGMSTEGVADLHFAKHRNGPTEELQLRFISNLTKFTDMNDIPKPAVAHEKKQADTFQNDSFLEENGEVHS